VVEPIMIKKMINQNCTDQFNACVERINQDTGEEMKMEKSVEDMVPYKVP